MMKTAESNMKTKKSEQKSAVKIVVSFLALLAVCFTAGVFSGYFTAAAEDTGALEKVKEMVKAGCLTALPYLFVIVGAIGTVLMTVFYLRCSSMYRKLMADKDNEELWDQLEDLLNVPAILSNFALVADTCLALCMMAVGDQLDKVAGDRALKLIAVGFSLYLVTLVASLIIQSLAIRMEKKLDPEKRGNVLDIHFRKVWMASCDEAQKLIAYKSGYKAFNVTMASSVIVLIACFLLITVFHLDVLSIIAVSVILLIHMMVFMLESARLEKSGR